MKRTPTLDSKLTRIAFAFAGMLGAAVPVQSGQLTIANEPLGAPAGLILPNVMFILDDSGSMGFEFMPDYVNDADNLPSSKSDTTFSTAACADSGDDDAGAIDKVPDQCKFGDPPYNSPDFNTIYYNPGITYAPGLNPPDAVSGTSTPMPSQNRANTGGGSLGWTKVERDPYLVPGTKDNLAGGYQDRVWCKDKTDAAAICLLNTAYQFPDDVNKFGETTSAGTVKYRLGSPYYYRMQTAQYCTTAARDVCVSGSSIVPGDPATPGTHTFMAPEYCSDAELVNCVAGAAVVPGVHIFSGPRWCADPGTLVDCRRKKIAVQVGAGPTFKYYIYAKHLGVVKSFTGNISAQPNSGTINVTGVNSAGGKINDITIGSVSVITSPIAFGAGQTVTDVAALIRDAIINKVASNFTATSANGIVTVLRKTAGVSGSGEAIVLSSNAVGTKSSKGRLALNIASVAGVQEMTALTVNGVNLLCTYNPPVVPPAITPVDQDFTNGVVVKVGDGRIYAGSGTTTSNRRNAFRAALTSRINTCAVGGFSVDPASGSAEIILVAPSSAGATPNDQTVARAGNGSLANFIPSPMGSVQRGSSSGDLETSVIAMSGGQDAFSGTRNVRVGVGAFSRTDIVSTVNSYAVPTGAKRTDCNTAGTAPNCTYDEEMTNFANWYTYYRSRMQMMKTSVGLAFESVDANFRVGFITICPVPDNCQKSSYVGTGLDLSKYLRIADFTPSQKNAWYKKLYATKPNGGTPLREGLARVGQIYAGVYGTGLTVGLKSTGDPATTDDPMVRSCQPNFALLSTDGYWNLGPGRKEDGTTLVGNPDGKDVAPYSLQSQAIFDGGVAASSDTLADVAQYYYVTDLRTSGAVSQNNVPTTTKDTAAHQHMVTFTLGLGIDGELTFDPKYETQTAASGGGDFFDIKQGTKTWPVPVADAPSALDDLWHAAVNGRGVFYSVKDPAQLAKSLEDMRNQLQDRLGAGAAAATSNLQPVAGDNFAFTASFTTSAWTGDLKARTIDLSTGVVSTVSLWSAASFLDNRAYTSRVIFTFDPTDTTAIGGVPGSGNLLKHFCPPGSCPGTDGAGLTPAEMSLFATSQLSQPFPIGPKKDNATSESLVNYLRGDRSFENSSPTRFFDTDLYRSRDSLMGDIVNAQPAYVKRTPFSYLDAGFADGPSGFRQCTEGIGTGCGPLFPLPTRPRRGTVYAAANDGMLHAFETDTTDNPYFQTGGISTTTTTDDTFTGNNTGNGVERWTYIPGLVMPKLYKLANDPYTHTYLTDGTPQVGDIDICRSPAAACPAGTTQWRTILVAGLNSGGVGYYALDITNPLAPKGLWEFGHGKCYTDAEIELLDKTSDCHLGLTYGNAVITKRFSLSNPSDPTKVDRRWVVIVASGYNNTFGTPPNQGDGRGYIYILDALTGKILERLSTGTGTVAAPSGLAKINGWTESGATDNTALAIYGGDLEGNLWRFKLDSMDPKTFIRTSSVTKIAVVTDKAGNLQPITVKPELARVGAGERVIVFGTGQFLELADKTPPEKVPATIPPTILPFPKQTIYALKDTDLSDTSAGPLKDFEKGVRVAGVTELEFVDSPDGSTRTINAPGLPAPAPACNPPKVVPPACSVSQNIPNLSKTGVLGWRIDLPENGERVNVDPVLQLGTLVIASNVPTTDSCSAGGFSFINFIDVTTGSFVKSTLTSTMASVRIASSILVGVNVVMLPGGAVKTIGTLADESRRSEDTPVPPVQFTGRRVSWRELFVE